MSVPHRLRLLDDLTAALGASAVVRDPATVARSLKDNSWLSPILSEHFALRFEVRDAQRHRVPHLLVIPCLIMTFMLGPIGLLAYTALRTWKAGTPVPDAA